MATNSDIVRLQGADHFRQRVILSILSAKVLRIDEIRSNEERPGLTDYEANFLRLVSKITNGTYVFFTFSQNLLINVLNKVKNRYICIVHVYVDYIHL